MILLNIIIFVLLFNLLNIFLGEYFYLKYESSNIIIFNIISLFMSLDLIKKWEYFLFNNLFIEEHYIALSVKYFNNYTWLRKNLRWRYIRTIVSVMIMLSVNSTYFSLSRSFSFFVHVSRNMSWNATTLCRPLSPWIRIPLIRSYFCHMIRVTAKNNC